LLKLATPLVVATLLNGCSTLGRSVDEQIEVSPEAFATAKRFATDLERSLEIQFALSKAGVQDCINPDESFRPPFSLTFNPVNIKDEAIRTAIFRISGANDYPAIVPHTQELARFAGKRVKSVNGVDAIDLLAAYRS